MAAADSLLTVDPDGPGAAVLAGAARASRIGRTRLATLAGDLFRDDDIRIDEARRTRMRATLDALVRAIEGRVRRDVADRLEPVVPTALVMALRNMTQPIARPVLDSAGTLADTDLVAVLARRVDEHRLVVQARVAATQDPELVAGNLFARLVEHPDAGVAAAARTVAGLAPGRHGRFEEPAVAPADLPATVRVGLIWRIAAGVRHWLALHDAIGGAIGAAMVDRAVAGAAAAIVAGLQTVQGQDDAALHLARAMLRAGVADDAATVALAAEGHVAVAVAGLALRSGIAMPPAWDMVLDPDGARLVLLLRAAGLERSAAAALLLRWPDAAAPIDRITERMAGYDALPMTVARDAIDVHRLDPGYLIALDALANGLAR